MVSSSSMAPLETAPATMPTLRLLPLLVATLAASVVLSVVVSVPFNVMSEFSFLVVMSLLLGVVLNAGVV